MNAKQYSVTITGAMPLLMHHDNLQFAEAMKAWSLDPANKAKSIAGDDRTPAHRWIGNLYSDKGVIAIPADNLMTVLREGGARCPTGKKGATFKRQTQSGLVVDQLFWPLLIGGKPVKLNKINELVKEPDFSVHEQAALDHGFELFCKRAKIGSAKHVRVRPMFREWSCSGSITVLDEMITKSVLQSILTNAGLYAGLGDWRPSSPKSPGSYGKFTAVVS